MEELNIDGRQWSSHGKLGFVNGNLVTTPATQDTTALTQSLVTAHSCNSENKDYLSNIVVVSIC